MNPAEEDLSQALDGEVGLVSPKDFRCPTPFEFASGQSIPEFTLRYETYGQLNDKGTNAILVAHALTGDCLLYTSDAADE